MEAVCGALDPYLLSSSLTGSPAQLPRRAAVSEVAACPRPPAQPARIGSLDLCLRRAGEQLCLSRATFSAAAPGPHVPRPAPRSRGRRTAVPAACSVCPHLGVAPVAPASPAASCYGPPGTACRTAQPGQRRDAPTARSALIPHAQIPTASSSTPIQQ